MIDLIVPKLMLIGIAVMAFALSLLGLFATKGMLFIVYDDLWNWIRNPLSVY